ncbi:helix-turn-helix domain-containing protein [Sphingorhabdus sp.]|uniref:helix-turn-helix domain-containing protein n=1 Tax=Sphingorhabdus sp. TaxID=1902408 RepID=UPI003BB0990B
MTQVITLPDEQQPSDMLAAVVALRHLADGLEQRAVRLALDEGWSWAQISEALGVSRQAAHKRLSHISSKSVTS